MRSTGTDDAHSRIRSRGALAPTATPTDSTCRPGRIGGEIAARVASLAGETGEAEELLERDPTLQRAIRLRDPYVDPMSILQVDALRRWREGGREDEGLERLLVQTVRGIARGLRNTG